MAEAQGVLSNSNEDDAAVCTKARTAMPQRPSTARHGLRHYIVVVFGPRCGEGQRFTVLSTRSHYDFKVVAEIFGGVFQ